MAYPTPFVPPVMTIPKPSAGAGKFAAPAGAADVVVALPRFRPEAARPRDG
jgi:hypothetical protein